MIINVGQGNGGGLDWKEYSATKQIGSIFTVIDAGLDDISNYLVDIYVKGTNYQSFLQTPNAVSISQGNLIINYDEKYRNKLIVLRVRVSKCQYT